MAHTAVIALNVAATLAAIILVLHKDVNDSLLERLVLSFIGTLAGVNSYTLIVHGRPVVSHGFLMLCFVLAIAYGLFHHRTEIRWHLKLH